MIFGSKKEGEEAAGGKVKEILHLLGVFLVHYFNLIAIFLALIAFLIGFLFLVKPKYEEVSETKKTYAKNQEELKSLDDYYAKLKEYKGAYDGISDLSKQKINKILPDQEALEEFFLRIDALISRQGLELKELSVDESGFQEYDEFAQKKTPEDKKISEQASKQVKEVKLTLLVGGTDYKSLKKLLASFESNLRIMDITNLNFSPERKTTSLNIKTYYQTPK